MNATRDCIRAGFGRANAGCGGGGKRASERSACGVKKHYGFDLFTE
jgi:hypothetical protein